MNADMKFLRFIFISTLSVIIVRVLSSMTAWVEANNSQIILL